MYYGLILTFVKGLKMTRERLVETSNQGWKPELRKRHTLRDTQ